jgi:hypothetical protein
MEQKPNPEHEQLIEILKFTPCTYAIQIYGYGGEYVMGRVDRKIYDYFKSRRLDIAEYSQSYGYAEEHNIPEDMQPFIAGDWYECDGIVHESGAEVAGSTLEITDQNDMIVLQTDVADLNDDGVEFDTIGEDYISNNCDDNTAVYFARSGEKGTFFSGEIHLKSPFDISKLKINTYDVDGVEVVCSVEYDGEDIDNEDMSTTGKSYECSLYATSSVFPETLDRYTNLDDIEYPMTEWFSKKIKPVHAGIYEIETADASSWYNRAEWTGTEWKSTFMGGKVLKIKQWRGIAVDPDTV